MIRSDAQTIAVAYKLAANSLWGITVPKYRGASVYSTTTSDVIGQYAYAYCTETILQKAGCPIDHALLSPNAETVVRASMVIAQAKILPA